MSFIVSSCFKLGVTTRGTYLIRLFQFSSQKFLEADKNEAAIASCFNVSVVSINSFPCLKVSEKVLKCGQRVRLYIVIGLQDYTKVTQLPLTPAASRLIRDWSSNG